MLITVALRQRGLSAKIEVESTAIQQALEAERLSLG
jgi:hypothetical protein